MKNEFSKILRQIWGQNDDGYHRRNDTQQQRDDNANQKMKNQDYQETMKRFMTEKERMNVMNEYVQDIMEGDEEEIEDDDVDKLIDYF